MKSVKVTKGWQLVVATVFTMAVSGAHALNAMEQKIQERIAPVAKVCVAGDECANAAAAPVAAAAGPARSAEEIYNSKCLACHANGVAGAPVVGNAGDWAPRIEQGLDTMVTHAINGFNAMPARGTCADCSDDDIRKTVEYMVSSSQ